MRVLIIGGTGLVGRHLLNICKVAGHEVAVVTRSADRVPIGAHAIIADISKSGWVMNAKIDSNAYDTVVHLAYATSQDATYDRAVTVNSVVELLRHFQDSLLKHFIYLGSMSIFGIELPPGQLDENAERVPDNDYAQNKIDASAAVMGADVSFMVSVLHPTGVYSATSRRLKSYCEMLAIGYLVLDSGGGGINNIVHAADVASAILSCAIRNKGERAEEYLINGEKIKYSEWFGVLEQHIGASQHRVPSRLAKLCRGPLRLLFRAARLRIPIIMPSYKRAMYERDTIFLSDKATIHFGYEPCLRFKDVMANDDKETSVLCAY